MADNNKANNDFHLTVVDPDKVIFEDDVKKLIAPANPQDIAILPDHTPLYSQILEGSMEITLLDDQIKKIDIDGGIIRVKRNLVSIIVGF